MTSLIRCLGARHVDDADLRLRGRLIANSAATTIRFAYARGALTTETNTKGTVLGRCMPEAREPRADRAYEGSGGFPDRGLPRE